MSKPDILSFLNDEFLMPQPEVLEHSTRERISFYWYSKECAFQEKKSTLGSRGCCITCGNGHKVYVESNLGLSSSFTDLEYSDAGAKICVNVKEVYES